MATVRGVTASPMRDGSMLAVSGRQSTKTGVAPQWLTASAVAMKVLTGTMTSSPGPTPAACSARRTASVPVLTPAQCSAPQNAANAASNSAQLRPHRVGGAREHRLEDLRELVVQLAPLRAQVDERYVHAWTGHATPRAGRRERRPRLSGTMIADSPGNWLGQTTR